MASRFGFWRQRIQQKVQRHPARSTVIIGATVAGGVLIIVILGGYWLNWAWKGFANKTLWNWLGLIATLAIPVVVGFGAAWFSVQQGKVSNAENKDNQREAALQTYIDKMSELLLDKKLFEPTEGYTEVKKVARVHTLTILPRLDADRKRNVIRFLEDAGLIKGDEPIVVLGGANLKGAKVTEGQLAQAKSLKGAIMPDGSIHP